MQNDLLERGRQALAGGMWEEARTLLEDAVRNDNSPKALEELAWACWWLNDIPAVFDVRTRTFNAFLRDNDKRGASRTASWLGLDCLELSGEFAVANGWFQRAENLLEGEPDCRELGLIKALKATLAFRAEKDPARALMLIDESLLLSKATGDVEGQMLAEGIKGLILVTEGRVTEGMRLLDEATLIAVSGTTGDVRGITTTCCFLIDACNRIRDYERADQWCSRVREICKRWRYRAAFASCRTQYAMVLIWRGSWSEAEDELVSAAKELRAYRPAGVNVATIRLADLRRRQGRWKEAMELLDEVKSHWLKPLVCGALAFDREFYDDALQFVEKFLRQIPGHEKTERIEGVELLLRIYVQLGKLDEEAVSVLNELREIEQSIATPPLKAARLDAEGTLEWARQNSNSARQHLEHAIDLYEQMACPFEASRARITLARVLSDLNLISQAEAEIQTAMTVFEHLGAEKNFARAKSMIRKLGTPTSDSGAFTSRELSVLRLIAEGKNNEEIADKLFLSVRTVEKHLTNIYQKLGVSGKSARAYAASFASSKLKQ